MLPSSHEPTTRGVNHLLHTLRGEQFRHSQNVRKSRTHISAATFTHNSHTLPIDFTNSDYPTLTHEGDKVEISRSSTYKNCPGPGPPKSWTLTPKEAIHDTAAWRARALSIVLPSVYQRSAPSLANLCLRIIASSSNEEFAEDIAPHLPPHIRCDLVRYTAVHSPLPNTKLYTLYTPDGHADSELIIVGPNAALKNNFFIRVPPDIDVPTDYYDKAVNKEKESWDSEQSTPEPLHTFVLMSTRLAASSLLSLPPAITKLALINLPVPISIHRLPFTCPLLVVFDLSYNTWLGHPDSAEKVLEKVEWNRWGRLRVLGLRECYVANGLLLKLNGSRWDEVEVVH